MASRDMSDPMVGSKRAHSPRPPPPKRAKAAQACLSCRKHKTRCEMLEGDHSGTQCHRCRVLGLSCSFEDGSGPPHVPSLARVLQPEIPAQSNIDRRSSLPPGKIVHDVLVDDMRANPKVWGDARSDALPPFRGTPRDVEEAELLHPERLLSEKHSPWGFLKHPDGFESIMVPMLAIQALTRNATSTADSDSWTKVDQTLLHVLGREQVKYLVDIFGERYGPWLNLQPNNHNDSPLLRLAQCCVASRHLEPSIRSIVTPQLYRLADDVIFKQTFNPLPSTDAIHAILILSLWEPVGDTASKEPRDGRLMAATAVSMAMNLRLSEAMVYASTLCSQKKPNEPPSAELLEALDKARLWLSLNTVESMLCAGTGREPISDCRSLIYDALDTTSYATIGSSRDLRLSLLCQLFANMQQGLSIRLKSLEGLDVFYKEVLDFLIQMDHLERLITPLPVLAEHEVFYFRMLQVYYQSCRLLVLVHALVETKLALSKTNSQPWFLVAEHNGVNLAHSWGYHALVLSEAILITTISQPELALMSTAPDNLFSMITFATIFVILSKWSVLENAGQQMPGSSDSILARTIERLLLVACSPDHFAAKCARLIEAGVLSFKKKTERLEAEPKEFQQPVVHHFMSRNRAEFSSPGASRSASVASSMGTGGYAAGGSTTSANTTTGFAPGSMDAQHTFPHLSMSDPGYFMGSDILLDGEFWSSFMPTLSDENGMSMMGR